MIDIDHHDNPFSVGYYSVGERRYADKIAALIDGTRSNIHPEWNFHREVFDKYPWSKRCRTPLKELYRRRALFLREKYDYLTLYYSGGSDSYTILKTFLDNNIKLDEVYVRWAVKDIEKLPVNATNKHASNVISEWELTIKPDLKYLSTYHPEIKITVDDFSDEIVPTLSSLTEDNLAQMGVDFLGIGALVRLKKASQAHIDYLYKGKTACAIIGLDKPRLVKKQNKVYMYFLDIVANQWGSHRNKHVEAFYWSPDCPDLIREQSHLLFDFFKTRPNLHTLIDIESWGDTEKKSLYDKITRSIVYPDWNPKKFQADKPVNGCWYIEIDDWIKARPNDGAWLTARWQHFLNNVVTGIDKKYLSYRNNRAEGFVGFISPFYELGSFENLEK
jgi:hypothetical protein